MLTCERWHPWCTAFEDASLLAEIPAGWQTTGSREMAGRAIGGGEGGQRSVDEYRFSTHVCVSQQEMEATGRDVLVILEGLGRNILEHLGDVELGKSIRVFVRDPKDRVVGGIVADLFGGWAYISLLWVEPSLRNRGIGSELLRRLEEEAGRLDCRHAHLDTYSFEARPFYEKWGYEVFGTLEDYPQGHCKYFMKKGLGDRVLPPRGGGR
jgi:GNAT superfamily N-acetyltransferase